MKCVRTRKYQPERTIEKYCLWRGQIMARYWCIWKAALPNFVTREDEEVPTRLIVTTFVTVIKPRVKIWPHGKKSRCLSVVVHIFAFTFHLYLLKLASAPARSEAEQHENETDISSICMYTVAALGHCVKTKFWMLVGASGAYRSLAVQFI